jgi:hypothetical protein
MWGGNTSDPKNYSPKNQEIFYRNFKVYSSGGSSGPTDSGGTTASSGVSTDSSATTVSGSFAPIFPAAGLDVKPFAKIAWKSHENADKYYIRIIDRSSSTTRMQATLQAYEISCYGAEKRCEVPYTGSTLEFAPHRMVLRALKDGVTLEEYRFDFSISSDGTSYSSSGDTSTTSDCGGDVRTNPTSGWKCTGDRSRSARYHGIGS